MVDADRARQRTARDRAALLADQRYEPLREAGPRFLRSLNWLAIARRLAQHNAAHTQWLASNPPFWAQKWLIVALGMVATWLATYGLSSSYTLLACLIMYLPLSSLAAVARSAHWWRRLSGAYSLRLFAVLQRQGYMAEALELGEALSARSGRNTSVRDAIFTAFDSKLCVTLVPRSADALNGGGVINLHFGGPDGRSLRISDCTSTGTTEGVIPDHELDTPSRLHTIALDVFASLTASDAPVRDLLDLDALRDAWLGVHLPADVVDSLVSQQAMLMLQDPAVGKGLLLTGPPGTGKTLIAKTFARGAKVAFFQLNEADLKHDHIGASAQAVRKLWDEAIHAAPSVIFIDECEGVFGRRGGAESDSVTAEIVRTFLPLWDGTHRDAGVFVVGASNRPELIDPAIRSRFAVSTHVGLPNDDARQAILGDALDGIGLPRRLAQQATVIADTAGCSGRELQDLALSFRRSTLGDDSVHTNEHFAAHVARERQQTKTAVNRGARWDTLVVAPDIREAMQDLAYGIEHHAALSEQGFSLPRGVLLFGPPGTGKTQIARTLANEAKCHFVSVTTAELKAGFIGQSGQRVKALFDDARAHAPTIVFLDELDALAGDRGQSDSYVQELVTQLLQEMDGVQDQSATPVVVIGATNRPDVLDAAILSRFAERYEVALPDADQRAALAAQLATTPPFTPEARVSAIEQMRAAVGLSHRDIAAAINRWTAAALRSARQAAADSPGQPLSVGLDVVGPAAIESATGDCV